MTSAPITDSSPLARLLYTTPLGEFCRHPEIAEALAQDRLAATLTPWLQVPDLFGCEHRLFRDWQVERPEAAAFAQESAAAIEVECAGMAKEVLQLRLLIHLTAHRRIDAAAVGREVFLPCAPFFGEPHVLCELPQGLALKVGTVRMANYWPRPEMEARSRVWRANRELVQAVERSLFSLLPPPGPDAAEQFGTAAALWLRLKPLRDFEARSSLPLFPYSTIYPDGYCPRAYKIRIPAETMRRLGGSYLTLAAAGLSPYIADPFLAYCDTRKELLAEWTEDLVGLAIGKWGHFVMQPA